MGLALYYVGNCLRKRSIIYYSSVRSYSVASIHPPSIVTSVKAALEYVKPNQTLLCGGFGLCGIPDTLINELETMKHIDGLTAISNNAGIDGHGLSKLLVSGQVAKMISSYIGGNKTFERYYLSGKIALELTPQGSLAERLNAGASGVPAFYTSTGANTWVEEGNLPVLYNSDGTKVLQKSLPRETRYFKGKKFLLEEALTGDVALIKAYKADKMGNCWFRGSAHNFNSVMAKAAAVTIVEAEHIVEVGTLKPEEIHLPGVYVTRVVQSTTPKGIEVLVNREQDTSPNDDIDINKKSLNTSRHRIARRAAKEFRSGYVANLGIGMPTLALSYVPPDVFVNVQSENGVLGMGQYPLRGEEDPDYINASKETVTFNPGASVFGSEESFAMIRSGRIDVTMLGGMQVSMHGDLANWSLPGKVKGMGGAMDLVSNPGHTRVIVLMEHVDKKGNPKIVRSCTFPLTGKACVSRIITDLAVFDVDPEQGGLLLVEIQEGSTLEEVRSLTGAPFSVSDKASLFN